MKTENIVMCVVALLIGMLLANMLKNVCGCKTVEGLTGVSNGACASKRCNSNQTCGTQHEQPNTRLTDMGHHGFANFTPKEVCAQYTSWGGCTGAMEVLKCSPTTPDGENYECPCHSAVADAAAGSGRF